MTLKKYIEYVKQDIRRTYKAMNFFKKETERTYVFRIYAIFILNILGVIGFAIMKEKFPVSVFCALCAVSVIIIIDTLRHVFHENIEDNLPFLFENEYKKYGTPKHNFKCYVNFVGNTHFRGFRLHVFIYEKKLILKFGKNCLIIDDGKQVEINKVILGYRCEFNKDGKYVQCALNKKQAEVLQSWQNENIGTIDKEKNLETYQSR